MLEVRTLATAGGSADARYIGLRDQGLLVPCPIRVWSEDPTIPVDVELVVTVNDADDAGGLVCTELSCRQRPGGPPVDGAALRKLQFRELIHAAIVSAALPWDSASGSIQVGSEVDDVHVAGDDVKRIRQGRRRELTDALLTEAADVYRAAVARHQREVTEHVAAHFGIGRTTAARWVQKARERGLLGAALRGVAGEKEER